MTQTLTHSARATMPTPLGAAMVSEGKQIPPSVEKYGTLLLEHGFTQIPNAVRDIALKKVEHGGLGMPRWAYTSWAYIESQRRPGEQWVRNKWVGMKEMAAANQVEIRRQRQIIQWFREHPDYMRVVAVYGEDGEQRANAYDPTPLLRLIAAKLDPQVAIQLAAEQEALKQPFEPADPIEQIANDAVEILGEPEPETTDEDAQERERDTMKRTVASLLKQIYRAQQITLDDFQACAIRAMSIAKARREEKRESGRLATFQQAIIPYYLAHIEAQIKKKPKDQLRAQQARQAQAPAPPPEQPPGAAQPQTRPVHTAHASKGSKGKHPPLFLKSLVEDISREFHNQQGVKSNISQASTLYVHSGMEQAEIITAIYEAKRRTLKAVNITHKDERGQSNRMPYFFSCLRTVIKEMQDVKAGGEA